MRLPQDFQDEILRAYKELSPPMQSPARRSCHGDSVALPPRTCPTRRSLDSKQPSSIYRANMRCSVPSKSVSPASSPIAHSHRVTNGFDHMKVALSVGIQQMVAVRGECAGVMFTIDTESGFKTLSSSVRSMVSAKISCRGMSHQMNLLCSKPTMAIPQKHHLAPNRR